MSSSMKNSIQRRNHRERAQPSERTKWGLLEKPKDYKLRAADHRVKKRKLKTLQQKARERNEDEFYFSMVNSETKNGVRVARRPGSKVLSEEVVKLMKTQDVGYLRTTLQQTRRERGRLEEEATVMRVSRDALRLNAAKAAKSRISFNEDSEAIQPSRPQDTALDSDSDGIDDEENHTAQDAEATDNPKGRALNRKRRRLEGLRDRERDLAAALEEVEDQRARMNGSIGGTNKNGVKFKMRQRRR